MATPALPHIYFAIPGDITTLTGGYGYDRRLLHELTRLGMRVEHLQLSGRFPTPDSATLAATAAQFAALPDDAIVLVDGLAFGVMDEIAITHGNRLRLIALCHHPLMLETGLSVTQSHALHHSEQRALAAARAILVTSTPTRAILTEAFSLAPAKITVALPGTDRQVFARCNGNPPILLTVATLTRRKAHDVLIDALARIVHLPWIARFVGGLEFDPAWVATLQQKVADYGLGKRILFIGEVAATTGEYAHADLFVLPSLFEGYGMAFAEALAFGLPIVAARTGAVPNVVPETAGILVAPGDIAALGTTLATLLGQPSTRKTLQQGAQQAAQHLPDWAATAQIVANLIHTVRQQ